jgi:Domain of unknown function (DUF2017)
MKKMIRSLGNGRYRFRLADHDRQLMRALAPQLREAMMTSGVAELKRLHPPAYANDADRDAEYQALVHDELLEKRLAALERVEATVDADEIDEAELNAWMTTVNNIRLILGTRLDVSEDEDFPDPTHPQAPEYAIYYELGFILDQIVGALGDF